MDPFETTLFGMVDLDNLETYPDDWKVMKPYDLWREAWLRAGESLFYILFIHPEMGTSKQAYRIYRMCKELAEKIWPIALEDKPESRLKVMKWLYRFVD
jgi:hypothetical protein